MTDTPLKRIPTVRLRRRRDGHIKKVNRHEFTMDIGRWRGYEIVSEAHGDASDREMEFQQEQFAIEMDRRHKPEEQKKRGDAERAQAFHNLGEVNTGETEIHRGGESVWHDLGFEDADERMAKTLVEVLPARTAPEDDLVGHNIGEDGEFKHLKLPLERTDGQEIPKEEAPEEEIEIPKMRWFTLRAKVAKKLGMESKGIRDKAHALDLLRVAGITDWSQVDG